MNGSQIILSKLLEHGTTNVFGYPGGAIMPLYDALPQFPDLNHILVRHEQATVFAAQGWARSTGQVGVAFATSGPGCANTITALADAMMDSIPVILITGQVFSHLMGKDAFQEMDTIGVTMNICKHNFLVRHIDELGPILDQAFTIARSGRPGPVHIDVPKDIFFTLCSEQEQHSLIVPMIEQSLKRLEPKKLDETIYSNILETLQKSHRPILLVGHGVVLADARQQLRIFAEKLHIPTVSTLLAKGIMLDEHPSNIGILGMHGWYHANMAMANADCIINIASRFDDRIVGTYESFGKIAKIIHVDVDASELGKVVATDMPVHADAKTFLETIIPMIQQPLQIHTRWEQIQHWKEMHPNETSMETLSIKSCYQIRNDVTHVDKKDHIVTTDVGQHQMRAWQQIQVASPYHWMTSGGAGSMGFGIPSALGASFAHPDKTITVFVGDGGFQMSMNELQTIAEHQRNIKIIILNNGFLGMVRQRQELFFEKNYSQTPISAPDFVELGRSFGIASYRVIDNDECKACFERIYANAGPCLVDCRVIPEENVFPMVPAGKALDETICG